MDPSLIPVIGILASMIGLPGIILLFIYKLKKNKIDLEKLKYKKEILNLEVRQQQLKLEALQQENKHYDRKLADDIERL